MKSTNFPRSFALGSLLTLGLLGLSVPNFAQNNFIKKYPLSTSERNTAYDLVRTNSSTSTQKLVLPGTIETNNTVSFFSLIDYYHDARILFTNPTGTAVKDWRLQSDYDDRAFAATKIDHSNMLVAGHTGQGFTHEDRDNLAIPDDTLTANVFFTVFDDSGNLLHHKTYDFGWDDHAYSAVTNNSNSAFVLGRTYDPTPNKYAILLMEVDNTGSMVAAYKIQDVEGADIQPRKLLKISEDELLILATTSRNGGNRVHAQDPNYRTVTGSEILIVRVDLGANLLSVKTVNSSTVLNPNFRAMDMVFDGNFAYAVGSSDLGGWILKIDPNGTPLQLNSLSLANDVVHPRVIEPNAGNLWISGKTGSDLIFKTTITPALAITGSGLYNGPQSNYAGTNGTLNDQFIAGWDGQDYQLMGWPRLQYVCDADPIEVTTQQQNIVVDDIEPERYQIYYVSVENTPIQEITPSTVEVCTPSSKMAPTAAQHSPLFPNPANTEINLHIPGDQPASVQIYDVQGRMILHQSMEAGYQLIPVSGWENGIYMVRIQTGTETVTHRLAIQH